MAKGKICISKKILIVWTICIGIIVITLFFRYITSQKVTSQPKAAPPQVPAQIYCGDDLEDGEFPFTALVQLHNINKETYTIGAGTLFHPRWILTVAHLFKDIDEFDKTQLSVAVNITDKADFAAKKVEGKAYFAHKQFVSGTSTQTADNDIALIKLDKEISGMDLPDLPDDENVYLKGSRVILVGPGAVDEEIIKTSQEQSISNIFIQKLQKTSMPIIEPTRKAGSIPVKDMEFYMTDTDPCIKIAGKGDSGGPVLKRINDKYTLIGIIEGNDTYRYRSGKLFSGNTIATKTSYFRQWINEVVDLNNTFCTYDNQDVVSKSAYEKLKTLVLNPPLYYFDNTGIIYKSKTDMPNGARCESLGEANGEIGINNE